MKQSIVTNDALSNENQYRAWVYLYTHCECYTSASHEILKFLNCAMETIWTDSGNAHNCQQVNSSILTKLVEHRTNCTLDASLSCKVFNPKQGNLRSNQLNIYVRSTSWLSFVVLLLSKFNAHHTVAPRNETFFEYLFGFDLIWFHIDSTRLDSHRLFSIFYYSLRSQ